MPIDLLSIARTGVLASQAQLGVTSNNIANANTEGYHRQVAQQSTLGTQQLGNSFFGTGSYISDVKRIYNDYAARELRLGKSALGAAETSFNKLSELDQLFSQIGKAVPQSLNNLFGAMNSLADLPSDLGIRGSVLGSAENFAISLNQMQANLNGQMKQSSDQITSITERISEISKELANTNLELMKIKGRDQELLDKQDALILELSQYAQVNVIPLDTGAKSIMLGGSVMLVSGEVAMSMATVPGDPFSGELRVSTFTGSQNLIVDPSKVGGQLAALYDYRNNNLIPASHELGRMALGVADSFNQAQRDGFDLSGQVGADIFRDINDPLMSAGRVGEYANNTGSANLRVNIDAVGQLSGSAYELSFTAPASYQLKDKQTGTVTPLVLNGTALQGGAGFSIHIDSGALASGDRFEIRPTAGAAAGIAVTMTDPKAIAAAAAQISAAITNSGNTQVKMVSVDNRAAANFPVTGSEITLTINTAANTFEAFDSTGASLGVTPYVPPNISVFGFTFEVSSTAPANDSFTFNLSNAAGDNRNAVAMAKMSEAKLMDQGKSTLVDVYENAKLNVGSKTKAAEVRAGSADAIYSQAFARVESESGVNIDEEAANLLRFQQSYQASARIMTTAQEIFETLLSSVR
jgi:flagellar hook-associated protein 1